MIRSIKKKSKSIKKNIAVIYGGNSSEFEISVNSGKQVSSHIDKTQYNIYEILLIGASWAVQIEEGRDVVEIDKSDFSFTYNNEKTEFDCAVIIIHGTPGEDGLLQSYFEMMNIPFTTCNAFVSMLTFNKYAVKCFLRNAGIPLAKDMYINKWQQIDFEHLANQFGLPLFVKPNTSGSSCGITKVKNVGELPQAFLNAFTESDTVIVEEFIEGRELQQGVFKTAAQTINLPITEIISHNDFFDYEAKYRGRSTEITPANITPDLAQRITTQSSHIYDYLGCRGIVRIDYIIRNDDIYFLEINTIPGMSQASIVPQQLKAAGYSLTDAYTLLIEDAIINI